MPDIDPRRPLIFGEVAERYDRARPSYPAALIDDLVAEKPGRVLDVGCGTGKAATLFAARGCPVLGVEPDHRMAAIARRHGIAVEVATFESWEADRRTFDLVASAQAWHWVDRIAGPRKAAAVLRPQGTLAVFWNRGIHDAATQRLFDEAYKRYAPAMAAGYAPLRNFNETKSGDIAAIAATGLFEDPEVHLYTWQHRYSRDEWLDQLGTHSDHLLLPGREFDALSQAIAAAIEQLGGSITLLFQTELILARRR